MMPENTTSRHLLPFLAVAQAQKEITHNEALVRIDALLHPVVEDETAIPPVPLAADAGKCWLIADLATGEWQGKARQIAYWTGGSWRYIVPTQSMTVRNNASATSAVWIDGQWVTAPTIQDPQSGAVIDVEARAAIIALLSHFRMIGLFTA
jgi:Protein of unknown function (DUF2793)